MTDCLCRECKDAHDYQDRLAKTIVDLLMHDPLNTDTREK